MNSFFGRADKNARDNLLRILLLIILVGLIIYLVYVTGGTKKVFVQLMYIPIIMAALFWGAYGALVVGLLCGVLAGPFIPLDVSLGIMQDPVNWISRSLIFSLIGFLTGYMIDRINKLYTEKHERNLKSPFYNLPNAQKLFNDIEKRIRSMEYFRLIAIKMTNLYEIEKYIDNKLVYDIVDNLAKKLSHNRGQNAVYSYEKDELIVLVCEHCAHDYEEYLRNVLDYYFTFPVTMSGYKIRVSLKVGIYVYQGEEKTPIEIYNKARIAYEQGDAKESGIYYYDGNLESKRRRIHNLTGELLESIEKNELFVMYQPKINIMNNRITGVEALVRWKKNGTEIIEPNIFIPIAEEIGFINRIAKFVFDSVTTQINIWKSKGIDINCSINSSVNELHEEIYTLWAKDIIDRKKVDKTGFEIEITERAIAYNDKILIEKMCRLKGEGYQISIDDFGTGYNSLLSVGEIPFDKLKIDKYFTHQIDRREIAELVKHFIEYAHTFNKTVVAEGVETEEQLNVLKSLGCDEVQGFYYSKPLMPEELEAFYIEFCRRNG